MAVSGLGENLNMQGDKILIIVTIEFARKWKIAAVDLERFCKDQGAKFKWRSRCR